MNESDQRRLEDALPGWRVVVGARGGWAAQDPGYGRNGVVVEADDPDELIERVRAVVRVFAIAAGRATKPLYPQRPVGGLSPLAGGGADNGRGPHLEAEPISKVPAALEPAVEVKKPAAPSAKTVAVMKPKRDEEREIARTRGFEGDPCHECGQFTLVRNGTCTKCMSCGSTSSCS